MQATVVTRRLHNHRIWLVAILIVLLGILAVGTVVTLTRDDAVPATIDARPAVESRTLDNMRLIEMNALPEAAPAPVMTFEQIRFREINMLPGDDVSQVAPFSDQRGQPH